MRVSVKGREEQDDRSRMHDDCGMICVIVSCCVMCMIHCLCMLQVARGWDGTAAQQQQRGGGEVRSEEGLEAAED